MNASQGGTAVSFTALIDDVSHNGRGASLWAQIMDAFDACMRVSRRLTYQDFTTVTASANISWSARSHRPYPRQ